MAFRFPALQDIGPWEIVLTTLIGVSLLVEVAGRVAGIGLTYTLFLLIPVVLASLLYGLRGIWVAILLGGIHIVSGIAFHDIFVPLTAAWVFILLAIGLAVALVSGHPATAQHQDVNSWLPDIKSRLLSYRNIPELTRRRDICGLGRALENPDINVQYEAVTALGDLGLPEAVGLLVRVLQDDQYSAIRWRAAEALARIGKPSVIPLIACLNHPAEDVRWKAAIALGTIGDPAAVDPLVQLLGDHDRFVRSRAAYALGQVGSPAIGALTRALSEGDGNTRWGAVIALGQIGEPGGMVPVFAALDDKYEDTRSEALSSLMRMEETITIPLLIAFESRGVADCRKIAEILKKEGYSGLLILIRDSFGRAGPDSRRRLLSAARDTGDPVLIGFAEDIAGGHESSPVPGTGAPGGIPGNGIHDS